MIDRKKKVSSGISGLDRILNGLFIGDNVVWHDNDGILAADFCLEFIRESRDQNKPIIYVSFDRSPKNLIEKLGSLAQNQQLTVMDCFTNGKGDKARIFNKFYEKDGAQWPYQVIRVTQPDDPQAVSEAILGLHRTLSGDVRFVFESLTGMADLWGGEDHIVKFYSHTCPQLYELDTIAYWILEKGAHSEKVKAHINQIAQVAIDLSVHEEKPTIKLLKAENRSSRSLGKLTAYTSDSSGIRLDNGKGSPDLHDLGSAIKTFRKIQGMSQKELAQLVGVTPSNISQIEGNQVFPSIPALYKIADHLSVDVGSLFQAGGNSKKTIFHKADAAPITLPNGQRKNVGVTMLTPFDLEGRIDLFEVCIFPDRKLAAHFFQHKGEEAGQLLSGEVEMVYQDQVHTLIPGDVVYFKTEPPSQWRNKGQAPATFLWIKIK